MTEISVSQAIEIRKNILIEFDNFCKKNQIQYSLGYGTLLGAVRHKDIIPWDDDIDIIVSRSEFERMEQIRLSGECEGRYRFLTHRTNPEVKTKIGYFVDTDTVTCLAGEEQAYGLHIDIFPVDLLPESSFKRKKLLLQRKILHIILKAKGLHPQVHTGKKKWIRRILKTMALPFNEDRAIERLNKISRNSTERNPNSQGAFVLVEMGDVNTVSPKIFTEYAEYEYGGRFYPGVKDSDVCLKAWYGDYMALPAPEQRVLYVNPNVKYYWKNPLV